jgi:hypothetical protein
MQEQHLSRENLQVSAFKNQPAQVCQTSIQTVLKSRRKTQHALQ